MTDKPPKFVVVKDGQRVTDGLTEAEASQKADELRRVDESAGQGEHVIEVKELLFG